MYAPLQIPFILNQAFRQNISYTETPGTDGFVLCFWEMWPKTDAVLAINNVITADACIDLVADMNRGMIGFAGMSATNFHFDVQTPARFLAARLAPGAFCQLTGLPATAAMDSFLPVEEAFAGFDRARFFGASFDDAGSYLRGYLADKTRGLVPDLFTGLFHALSEAPPKTASGLCGLLHFSPRQCQRLFLKHYGLAPKTALSIIRFQKCLRLLLSPESNAVGLPDGAGYYDQPHFIRDFRRNIGITPRGLVRLYRD
jgi:AraC-like DNA-binding protein